MMKVIYKVKREFLKCYKSVVHQWIERVGRITKYKKTDQNQTQHSGANT